MLAASKHIHLKVDVAGYIHPHGSRDGLASQKSSSHFQAWAKKLGNPKVKRNLFAFVIDDSFIIVCLPPCLHQKPLPMPL